MEIQIFHHAKVYLIFKKKNPPKETKILHDIITLQQTISSSFNTRPNYHLSKILLKK
jgi:hypothetical protein